MILRELFRFGLSMPRPAAQCHRAMLSPGLIPREWRSSSEYQIEIPPPSRAHQYSPLAMRIPGGDVMHHRLFRMWINLAPGEERLIEWERGQSFLHYAWMIALRHAINNIFVVTRGCCLKYKFWWKFDRQSMYLLSFYVASCRYSHVKSWLLNRRAICKMPASVCIGLPWHNRRYGPEIMYDTVMYCFISLSGENIGRRVTLLDQYQLELSSSMASI